jgi:Flp pilus assembly protein TadB
VGAGFGVERFLRHREPAGVRIARLRAVADLPLCADLLAAALRAGAPVDRAAAAVADALGGPLGERLERNRAVAAARCRIRRKRGRNLSDVPGADRLVAAAIRTSTSGGALAGGPHSAGPMTSAATDP